MTSKLISFQSFFFNHFEGDKLQYQLTILLNSIQESCKRVNSEIRKAPLNDAIGQSGEENIQGETQQKLDVIANSCWVNLLTSTKQVAAMVSEEVKDIITVKGNENAPFIVCFDPLDGSSNIDFGIPIGSIFSVYLNKFPNDLKKSCLRPGNELILSGYSNYGSFTSLVIASKIGVNSFTLNESIGEFILTNQNIKIPKKGSIYSVNEGNFESWDDSIKNYVTSKKLGKKPYKMRYVGSMVADIHRTLFSGGIFLYPHDKSSPNGKLRLLYECNPMSFLIEQAGGKSFTEKERVLDVQPESIHQRKPIFCGSASDVEEIIEFIKDPKKK